MDILANAREHMVESQLMPNGVTDEKLLKAYQEIPREHFVPESKSSVAYVDEDIMIGENRFIMEPAVHARMVQALNLGPEDVVLDVACATGYSSAVLSYMAKTVVSLTNDASILQQAKKNWEALSIYNIVCFEGDLSKCNPEYAPYDAIIFNGSLPELPKSCLDMLNTGGRLVYIERRAKNETGRAKLIHKLDNDKLSTLTLFDASTPYLPGFEPKEDFVF